MKTEKELNEAILKITMKIRNDYPELSKYLLEMPVTIPDISNPEINSKTLTDYYESLENMLKKYISNHNKTS
ncbi:hypothetical protein [Flavobacterium yafengii]|jgi:hypothetical protein|uniref:Uncharacterized protein n=1 Tax=Flavobacterium yafengii TaxID=3041253 RepID=A0AAW6TPU0_9FLAO|nr:hypothetical protein [Flavobacterium yafengii]MDI5897543.1 hypothetical protein [Flavobacterium yafengii]MDI5950133.1 hypothetical protein [Flavobacterium yafengii]MDI6047903.1 hypothetical protein [Flavobacterium yafengii]